MKKTMNGILVQNFKKIAQLALLVTAIGLSACATQVQDDYVQYLHNNEGNTAYRPVTESVTYSLDRNTQNHSQEIRAWMTGIANSWTVRFGDILDATMQSADVRAAFGQVTKIPPGNTPDGLQLNFSLVHYDFSNFQATVTLKTMAQYNRADILDKTYQAVGISQGGKMFWGGAFGMKNAIQQSTKSALDKIFANLITDLREALKNPPERKTSATNPWTGNWFGENGPYQIFISIEGETLSGKIRTGGQIHDLSGSISSDGQLRARFKGDTQVPPIDLAGLMPTLTLYSGGSVAGNIRMDQRR